MGSEPRITKQELRELAKRRRVWDERAAAFDPFQYGCERSPTQPMKWHMWWAWPRWPESP
jgi:hypothetical protein